MRSTSPGRTGSWKTIVLSVMTASGSPKRSFRSKCTCSGSACCVRPGAQWCGPEPHRQHRRRRDRAAGDLVGDVVVPEQRVAVLDRRARRPDVAALDRELARLLVLHLADQRLDRRPGTVSWSSRHHSFLAQRRDLGRGVADLAEQRVGVGDRRVAHGRARAGRGPCPRAPSRPARTSPWPGASARDEHVARRGSARRRRARARSRPPTRTCRPGRARRPTRRGCGARTRRGSRRASRPAPRRRSGASSHCSQPSARHRLRRSAARSRRPRPTGRRRSGTRRNRRSGR